MTTRIDDDYLICKHYYNHINDISSEYKDFITYEHNSNHYFGWVNDGKVIMRSEAYPSHDKMVRGIKAIIKNRDIAGRYSIETKHGANFLLMWGGGDHQKHTGNFDKHNEIGRSCPTKSKEELRELLMFKGKDFVDRVFGTVASKGASKAGAAMSAAGAAALASTVSSSTESKRRNTTGASAIASSGKVAAETVSSGGGFKWWYLLPLLLIPLFFMWKGCGNDKTATVDTTSVQKAAVAPKSNIDNSAALKAAAAKEELARANSLKAEKAAEVKAASERRAAEQKAREKKIAEKKNYSNSISTRGNKSSGF